MLNVKVGQTVYRYLSTIPTPMVLKITAIDNVIHCGDWTFHKEYGTEIDECLGWDGVTKTGSVIYTERKQVIERE